MRECHSLLQFALPIMHISQFLSFDFPSLEYSSGSGSEEMIKEINRTLLWDSSQQGCATLCQTV